MNSQAEATKKVKVWDVPTRLFHWLIVVLFAFSWWSAENHEMEWHYQSGILVLALLVFRLLWGFIGGSTARFVNFVRSPIGVFGYLRGKETPSAFGHNPIGGYSVVALLLFLCIQVGAGLFATDIDGLESGPLSHLVSFDTGRLAAEVHETAFNVLLLLVTVHVLAILFYAVVRKRNLLTPMFTGETDAATGSSDRLVSASWGSLGLALVASAAIAWWVAA